MSDRLYVGDLKFRNSNDFEVIGQDENVDMLQHGLVGCFGCDGDPVISYNKEEYYYKCRWISFPCFDRR
jgi:hypothetical protein